MFFYPDRVAVIEMSGESSRTTHGATECIEASRLFGAILFKALDGAEIAEIDQHNKEDKNHPEESINTCNCETALPEFGKFCYKATCYQTTRELVKRIGLKSGQYSVSFQSRLSNNWMTPFTDQNLVSRAKQGCKNILVVAPAFVSDCLETTVEIGWEYKELFAENGGENLQLVESLNDSSRWIAAMEEILDPYV